MFSSEQEILREEIQSLQAAREKLRNRVTEVEEELKKARDDLEREKTKKTAEGGEDEVRARGEDWLVRRGEQLGRGGKWLARDVSPY